ncbi:hypothetical protein ACFOOK_17485 [Micromonospora krabiensis]|uniref:Uncharacterized protein n=1 Tax=Micromonospora krabiensis TaxID=307121 RepID=A0A1C3MZL4_9ACTN|nr:hypothetical protein [Micromonospora krabiensis]SBV25761.1 hypothetical protein GA0070620_1241 [Micromonospora krabiensis]
MVVEGFVYVVADRPGPMAGAGVGERVRIPSWAPPWIVVDHRLDRVLAGRWPGRLFRVRSVPPESDEERDALARAARNLGADAGYTRVSAVDVLEELRPGLLFGPHGDAVVDVLEHARLLTEPAARALAAARPPGADDAYDRAWRRWLDAQAGGAAYQDDDHRGVLAIPGVGPGRSPIGSGLVAVWTCVVDSARRRVGPAAFTVQTDDGEEDEVLLDPWRTAGGALLDAALALGAPDLVDAADAAVLTAAWRAVDRP